MITKLNLATRPFRNRTTPYLLSFLLLYSWILSEVLARRQRTYLQIGLQASFFIYVFMVLTLTGYFILFRELAGDWWANMMERIDRRDHVNLKLLQIFRIYKMSNTQVIGNFILLLPLSIYIQLLYPWFSHFLVTLLICILSSLAIEALQLATRVRSADVDDVLLNTTGAFAGLVLFRLVRWLAGTNPSKENMVAPAAPVA